MHPRPKPTSEGVGRGCEGSAARDAELRAFCILRNLTDRFGCRVCGSQIANEAAYRCQACLLPAHVRCLAEAPAFKPTKKLLICGKCCTRRPRRPGDVIDMMNICNTLQPSSSSTRGLKQCPAGDAGSHDGRPIQGHQGRQEMHRGDSDGPDDVIDVMGIT